MKVKATARGYYSGIREVGDVFDVPDKEANGASWFEPVESKPPAKAPAKPAPKRDDE